MSRMKRDFDAAAATWDQNEDRRTMSLALAKALGETLLLTGREALLDYGAGTGVVSLALAARVGRVICADASRGMLDVLQDKIRAASSTNLSTLLLDLERDPASANTLRADVVVSCMTLHHVVDVAALVCRFREILPQGGQLALCDLDTEDGSFHGDNTGVEHHGFQRDALVATVRAAGFTGMAVRTAHAFRKRVASGAEHDFSVFLLTARRM